MNDSATNTTATNQGGAVRFTQAIPCLSYANAHAAIQWLVDAFGAEARHVYDGPDNTVSHAEVWFGDCCVMMGSLKNGSMPPHKAGESAVYVVVASAAEVDQLHERAVQHNAQVVIALRDTDYGSHDFGVLDPEGNFWGFGTYAPA